MAWVRLHDGAMGNLKILRLSDSAFRLWVQGLCYCQTNLTDGLIPREALRMMGAKRIDVDRLSAVIVEGKSPLWEPIEGFGFKVHDYLDWNESKEVIMARRAAAEAEKQTRRLADRDRLARWREAKKAKRETVVETPVETPRETPSETPPVTPLKRSLTKPNQTKPEERERVSLSPAAPSDPFVDDAITKRAGRFVDRYGELYPLHRNGARYIGRIHRDYEAAVTLCQTWDDARLEKLAICFLTTDHKFAAEGSRTIPQFRALASWLDGELAKWEAQHVAR